MSNLFVPHHPSLGQRGKGRQDSETHFLSTVELEGPTQLCPGKEPSLGKGVWEEVGYGVLTLCVCVCGGVDFSVEDGVWKSSGVSSLPR